jgi:hypothetical protein
LPVFLRHKLHLRDIVHDFLNGVRKGALHLQPLSLQPVPELLHLARVAGVLHIHLPFGRVLLRSLQPILHALLAVAHAGEMHEEVAAAHLVRRQRLVGLALVRVEPALRHAHDALGELALAQQELHGRLVAERQWHVRAEVAEGQDAREQLGRPGADAHGEHAVVEPVPVVADQHVHVAQRRVVLGRQEQLDRHAVVEDDGVGVHPEEPFEPLAGRLCELLQDQAEHVRRLGPHIVEDGLAQHVDGIVVQPVVSLVCAERSFVHRVRVTEENGNLRDACLLAQ